MRHFSAVINPHKLKILRESIATYLGIPQSLILRFEPWANVLFVHRQDRGGQFISYRQLGCWLQACIEAIQACKTHQALQDLGQLLKTEIQRFSYPPDVIAYLRRLWQQHKAQLDLNLNLRSFYTPNPNP
ncbi:hypothetical protein [Leptolyngbya sp. FACHB-261]|uniref:hypothetical protein n=1 Tax=Leptolyngbya sp. FACHB-261 TaxID=2692806 RepID=UPI0016824AE8|nr:hypothetical protein [Leptolyngbya sp. FACHB-261]MBD2101101.1 hypothetical protein [Leptolyngbya sp. FACHB-261]